MANTQNLDLVRPIGTDHALVSDINGNSDKIDAYAGKVNTGLDALRDGLGVLADGNTHAAITSGEFVFVKNHQTLPEGVYKATANIAANGALSTSNLTADARGGLNSLNEQIGKLPTETLTGSNAITTSHTLISASLVRVGNIVLVNAIITLTSNVSAWSNFATINGSYKPANATRGYGDKSDTIIPIYVGVQGNLQLVSGGGQTGNTIVFTTVYSLV